MKARNSSPQYISAIGHQWDPPAGMKPVVLKVKEARRIALDFTHKLDDWTLDYFFTPGVSVQVLHGESPTLERKPFTAHLYAPGVAYHEMLTQDAQVHSAWMFIRGGELAGLNKFVEPAGFAVFEDPEHRLAKHIDDMAQSAQVYEDKGFWSAQAHLAGALDILHQARPLGGNRFLISTSDKRPTVHPLVVSVRGYLQTHMAKRVTLADMARHFSVSVSTLAHKYSTAMGEGPLKTLMHMRIQTAKDLLLRGNRLKEIADIVGFGNEYHLSKAFKSAEGFSPREFLKRAQRRQP